MLKYQGKKGKEQGYLKKQVQCGAAAPGLVGVRAPGEEVGERMGTCPRGVGKRGECSGRSCRNTGNHPEGLRSLPQIGVSFSGAP